MMHGGGCAIIEVPQSSESYVAFLKVQSDNGLQVEVGFNPHDKHCDQEPVYGFKNIAWSPTGDRWYRITGAAGNALALQNPGKEHCSTTSPGWLSSWNPAQGDPPETYSTAGRYPKPSEGTVDMTVW